MPCGTSGSIVVVEFCAVLQENGVQGLARPCFFSSLFSPFFLFYFIFFLFCFYGSVTETQVAQHQFIAPSPIKDAWRNNFSGPGKIILKALFLYNNSTRNSLLIHGFWPVNARLLIAYGTAFYAIILRNIGFLRLLKLLIIHCLLIGVWKKLAFISHHH